MTPFLQYIAQYVFKHHADNTEHLCIVLPNKRGALYLKQHLAKAFQKQYGCLVLSVPKS